MLPVFIFRSSSIYAFTTISEKYLPGYPYSISPLCPCQEIETNEYIVACGNTQRGTFKNIQRS